jgi:quercetin dioxygenase-like cupin family protein
MPHDVQTGTAQARVVRAAEIEGKALGSLAQRQNFTGDDGLPVLTGIQTSQPGYQTRLHAHPYAEYLFVLEGEMEAWLQGQEATPSRLGPGDMIVLPADIPHVFRCGIWGSTRRRPGSCATWGEVRSYP